MKKLLLSLLLLPSVIALVQGQSLEQIINSHSAAMKQDKLADITTIRITGSISVIGMEMPLEMLIKKPDKIKIAYSISGQDMISVFDGEKGYMINPMLGSTDPVELNEEQLKDVQNNNVFQDQLQEYLKNDQLSLEGEENIDGKPAFKIKAESGVNPVYIFIDKDSYFIVKTSSSVNQMGTVTEVDTYMSDYAEVNGIVIAKKTTSMANGMEASVFTMDKIEVNIPIDDTVFKLQ
jgi:hypothetical protein